MENVEYREWVPAGALVKGLFVMIGLIGVIVTFGVVLFSGALMFEDLFWVGFTWVILAVLFLVFWNYRGLCIQIKDDRLFVEYGRLDKKSFVLNEISSCKKTRASLGRYFGVGIRYGFDGSLAYTTSFGEAVEIVPNQGKIFVFSSKNSDRVCDIINRRKRI
jgi:hypothetical protein